MGEIRRIGRRGACSSTDAFTTEAGSRVFCKLAAVPDRRGSVLLVPRRYNSPRQPAITHALEPNFAPRNHATRRFVFGPTSVHFKDETSDARSCKRHQRRHLELCTALLLSRGSGVRVSPGAPSFMFGPLKDQVKRLSVSGINVYGVHSAVLRHTRADGRKRDLRLRVALDSGRGCRARGFELCNRIRCGAV